MAVGMLASSDGTLGVALGTEQSGWFINRTGSTLVAGETYVLDIQQQAPETVNFLEGDPGSVWVNVIQARNFRDFDDKPYVCVTGEGVLEDDGKFRGSLWSREIQVLCQARTISPAPNPLPIGTPICAGATSTSPYVRNMKAQQATVNRDGGSGNPYDAITVGRARDQGAKYTGRIWETIAHDVTANRLCLWNGWTGFGLVSHANP